MKRSALFVLLFLFLFVLVACAGERYDETLAVVHSGMTYSLKIKDHRVCGVEVSEGGKTLYSASLDSDFASDDPDKLLAFEDYNFDSLPDMKIRTSADEPVRYQIYLWDETRNTYARSHLLSSLENPTPDPEEGVIRGVLTSLTHEAATADVPACFTYERSLSVYRFKGASLRAVSAEKVTYYSESDLYCYGLYEENEAGELDVIKEVWMHPEKFRGSEAFALMPSLPEGETK